MLRMKTPVLEAKFETATTFDTKAVTEDEDGTLWIEGLASTYSLDDQDEMFVDGAFDAGIDSFLTGSSPLLFHHDGSKCLGEVEVLEPRPEGLHMKARIDPPKADWAIDVVSKIKTGSIKGLSVAGKFRRRIGDDGTPEIYHAGLREISVTPLAVNSESMFEVAQKAFGSADLTLNLHASDEEFHVLGEALAELKKVLKRADEEVSRRYSGTV